MFLNCHLKVITNSEGNVGGSGRWLSLELLAGLRSFATSVSVSTSRTLKSLEMCSSPYPVVAFTASRFKGTSISRLFSPTICRLQSQIDGAYSNLEHLCCSIASSSSTD